MYKMELKQNEKIFLITLSGMLSEKESISYVDELKKNIKSINPTQYNLVVDAREMKTAPQQLKSFMEEGVKLISAAPFKKRYSISPKSVVANMQINSIGKRDNAFNNMILIESYQEVLGLIA